MHPDELIIFQFLTAWPGEYVGAQQICRQADGRRRFQSEPKWAYLALARMAEQGILETDGAGRFRLPVEVKSKPKAARWVSPQIQQILSDSGKFNQPNV